jgi:hypothetical protein
MGAITMTNVRAVKYAQRDPWAGATNLCAKSDYIRNKNIAVDGPFSDEEAVQLMLFISHEIEWFEKRSHQIVEVYERVFGGLVDVGKRLARDGSVRRLAESGAGVDEAFDFILNKTKEM